MQPLDADDLVGGLERAVEVAPVEGAVPDVLLRDVVVEVRRVGVGGALRVDDGRERLVLDLDELGRVARELARRRATTAATGSPTWRTLPTASA